LRTIAISRLCKSQDKLRIQFPYQLFTTVVAMGINPVNHEIAVAQIFIGLYGDMQLESGFFGQLNDRFIINAIWIR